MMAPRTGKVVATGAAAVVAFVLIAALAVSGLFVEAWIIMLLVGALHSVVEQVPALGYWPVVGITLLLSIIGGFFRR